jgi:mxaJ protein
MIAAIVAGELDACLLWGPQAGWFAQRAGARLAIVPAKPPATLASIPFEFGIAMGVQRGNIALRDELNAILVRRRADIDAILAAYHVPRTDVDP